MALTADSLHKLETQYLQQSQSTREFVDRFVMDQRRRWGSSDAHARSPVRLDQHHLGSSIRPPRSKRNRPDALGNIKNDPLPKIADQSGPHTLQDPLPRSAKRPRQPGSSNSSIIQCASREWNLTGLEQNVPDGEDCEPPTKVDRRRTKNFQKRPRHKMREMATNAAKSPRKRKKFHNEVQTLKHRTDTLGERLSSAHVGNPRITLRPSHRLGIFKKGREAGHAVPDLFFSDVPLLQAKPKLNIGAYDDGSGGRMQKPRQWCREHVSPQPNSRPRLPSDEDFSSHPNTGTESIFMETQNHILEIGPYDSVSQLSAHTYSQVPDQGSSDNHSEYSRLDYQTQFLARQDVAFTDTGARPSAPTFAEIFGSRARESRHQTTPQPLPLSRPPSGSPDGPIQEDTDRVSHHENGSSEKKSLQIVAEPPGDDVSQDDPIDPLDQILSLCKNSPRATTPHQGNKVETGRTQICAPAFPRMTLNCSHQSMPEAPTLRHSDDPHYATVYSGVPHATGIQATLTYRSGVVGNDVIEVGNRNDALWGGAQDGLFIKEQEHLNSFPNIRMMGQDGRITDYQAHEAAASGNLINHRNADVHRFYPIQESPSINSSHSPIDYELDQWGDVNVLDDVEYSDDEPSAREEIMSLIHAGSDYLGPIVVNDIWPNKKGDVFPCQHERGITDVSAPRNFWRPYRLS